MAPSRTSHPMGFWSSICLIVCLAAVYGLIETRSSELTALLALASIGLLAATVVLVLIGY